MSDKQRCGEDCGLLAKQVPYPWQLELSNCWLQNLNAGRLPSAVLLTGAVGSGKADLAKFWAKSVLCKQRAYGEGYCGKCYSCHLFDSNNHPDFYSTDMESAQLTVDWARELNVFWQRTASRGGFKVALIEQAERLNLSAANALLKSIEELPKSCCAIFVTDKPGQLPITLRSRCVSFKLQSIDHSVIRDWIVKQLQGRDYSSEHLELLLRMFPFSPLLIFKYLSNAQFWEERELLFEQLISLNASANFNSLAKQWLDRQTWLDLVYFWQSLICDILKIKLGIDEYILNADRLGLIKKWASCFSLEKLMDLEKWLRTAANECQKLNINSELFIETLFYKWFRLATP